MKMLQAAAVAAALAIACPAAAQVSGAPAGQATAAKQDVTNTALGAPADAAWSGSGSGSLIGIDKYIAAKVEAVRGLLAGAVTVNLGTLNGAATAANQTATQANAGSDASKAQAVQGVAGGKAVGTSPGPTSSTTDRSVSITTGGTAQVVMGSNASRRSFYLFNPNSSGTCWASVSTTTPAANGLGAFPVAAGSGFGMETSPTTNAIYVNCPTTGQFITAWESQ